MLSEHGNLPTCEFREFVGERIFCHHERAAGPVSAGLCGRCRYVDLPSTWVEIAAPRAALPLGNWVAAATDWLGWPPCGRCKGRQAWLNRLGQAVMAWIEKPPRAGAP